MGKSALFGCGDDDKNIETIENIEVSEIVLPVLEYPVPNQKETIEVGGVGDADLSHYLSLYEPIVHAEMQFGFDPMPIAGSEIGLPYLIPTLSVDLSTALTSQLLEDIDFLQQNVHDNCTLCLQIKQLISYRSSLIVQLLEFFWDIKFE